MVNTVLGPVDTANLGFTLSHEHVGTNAAGLRHTYPEIIDRAGVEEQATAALKEAYDEGLRTMVDVSPFDLGRDIQLIQEVSRGSGVNIIAATGNHLAVPRPFGDLSPDVIAPLFVREIEEGIEGTGIKAAIIKVANDVGGVTPEGEIILRAAARAQKATGVPISTHTWAPERVGEQQVRIFEDEGVDLNRVYVGHSNDTTDTEYLIGLLEKALPDCSREDLFWGYHFVTGALMLTLGRTGRIDRLSDGLCKSDDFEAAKERMASFMAGGFHELCKKRKNGSDAAS